MKLIKNKRGDLPITILVIGIIAICIFTILSFSFSIYKSNKSFFGPGLIETICSVEEELLFKQENGFSGFSEFSKEGVKVIVDLDKSIIKGNYNDLIEIEYVFNK
jgi:hypothetical protein